MVSVSLVFSLSPYSIRCSHRHLLTFIHAVPEVVAIGCRIQFYDMLLDGVELLVHDFQLFLNRPNKIIEVIDGVLFDDDDCLELAHREIAMLCEKGFKCSSPMIQIFTALYPEIAIERIPDDTLSNLFKATALPKIIPLDTSGCTLHQSSTAS